MTLKIAVIDDWQQVASDVVDWSPLQGIGELTFIHDYPADTATLSQRLADFEVICVMRERTRFDAALLRSLLRLKLLLDRKSTRLNSSHLKLSRMPSSA